MDSLLTYLSQIWNVSTNWKCQSLIQTDRKNSHEPCIMKLSMRQQYSPEWFLCLSLTRPVTTLSRFLTLTAFPQRDTMSSNLRLTKRSHGIIDSTVDVMKAPPWYNWIQILQMKKHFINAVMSCIKAWLASNYHSVLAWMKILLCWKSHWGHFNLYFCPVMIKIQTKLASIFPEKH